MSDAGLDLTGHWHGIFNYPDGSPPTEFEAELREIGGIVTGETTEPSDGIEDIAADQCAFIEGRRAGHAVTFVKRYDEMHRDPVHYDGTISDEGTEVSGRWTIAGEWSGTFLMIRPARQEAEAEQEIAAPVD